MHSHGGPWEREKNNPTQMQQPSRSHGPPWDCILTNGSEERNTKRFNPVDNRDVVFKSTWMYLRRGLKRLVFLSSDSLIYLNHSPKQKNRH